MDNESSLKSSGSGLPVLKVGGYTPAYPLIQGGMGIRISASSLAGAVAANGAIGTIASVGLGLTSRHYTGKNYFEANKTALKEEITLAREKAPHGIIAVNCIVALTDYEAMVRTAAESGAQIIISGAGLPMHLPEYTSDFPEVALVPIVSSKKAARLIVKRWEKSYKRLPDAFVVEAPGKAGGHLGAHAEDVFSPELTLESVVPELVEFIEREVGADIPVVAAGGVWDREDMLHAFSLGARGVQIGTRFACTRECDASDAFKQTLVGAREQDVVLVKSPVGLPGRAVKNKFVTALEDGTPTGHKCFANCLKNCSFRETKEGFCITTALANAQRGDVDNGLVFCGSNVVRCKEIVSVADIIDELFLRGQCAAPQPREEACVQSKRG